MAFGITSTGFVLKRFEDIKKSLEDSLKASFGPGINLSPDGRFGKLVSDIALPLAELWELGQDGYDALNPDNAEDVALENIVAFIGLSRLGATKGFVQATAWGDNGTVLAAGKIASVDATGARFTNLDEVTIDAALQQETVTILEAINTAIYTIMIDAAPFSYIATLTDTLATIAAQLAQAVNNATVSDVVASPLSEDVRLTAAKPGDSFVLDSVTASVSYPIVAADGPTDKVSVQGDVTALFGVGQAFTIPAGPNAGAYTTQSAVLLAGKTVITTNEDLPSSTVTSSVVRQVGISFANTDTFGKLATWTAESAGVIQAPKTALKNIETPVANWNGIHNSVAGTPGRNLETNQELRLRREESLRNPGSATIEAILAAIRQVEGVSDAFVYENDTIVVDGFGLPPKSIQAIVVGGADADLAQAIFNSKSAGIQAFGTEGPFIVVDSQGFDHEISFTRPTAVPIYLVYNITLDPEQGTYPADGDDKIKALAVAFGNATFGVGQNVAPWRLVGAITIPGIGEVELLVQRDSAPGPSDTGAIEIDPDEYAEFVNSPTRVIVNQI